MKLREKFITSESIDTKREAGMFADKCEEIAEDFAIGFAEWMPYNAYKESICWRMYDKKDNEYTIQELIKIYKKENEL